MAVRHSMFDNPYHNWVSLFPLPYPLAPYCTTPSPVPHLGIARSPSLPSRSGGAGLQEHAFDVTQTVYSLGLASGTILRPRYAMPATDLMYLPTPALCNARY
eukprot:2855364-Rhodomonas_salina.3